LTLQQLRDFVVAVKHGSLRRAATSTGQSQVSLTKSIKRLELSLGTDLLIRNSRGIALTPDGERLLPRARLILSEALLAQSEASTVARGQRVVSFGASPLASLMLAPAALQEFRHRCPDVVVRCANGPYARLLAELLAGNLDFVACPVLDHAVDDSLVVDAVSRHRSVIVARKGHPLKGVTSLRGLADSAWIVNGPLEHTDTSLTALFREHGLPAPRIAMVCESFVDAIAHVSQSDLLSLCPPCLDALGVNGRVSVIFTVEQPPEQTVLLMRRRDRVLSQQAFRLYEIFRKYGELARRLDGTSSNSRD